MSAHRLTRDQRIDLYYWMRLTRTFDDMMVALWKQGRGLGGTFSQQGHEATSVGTAYVLGPDDVIAPMHRDLGSYLVRGISPRRIFANMLGRASGVSGGRDANIHGCGDLDLNIIGFISHLPQSLPVAVGVAMSFNYRKEARVALTYVGDGSASAGVFHESLNLAAVFNAPVVVVIENNRYAYSTPVEKQVKIEHLADRAAAYGIPGIVVDGNDVEAVYRTTKTAVERAREGGGPTLIEAKTMRMLGHAIHDGAEYVPQALLEAWERRNPVDGYKRKLIAEEVADGNTIEAIDERCRTEIADAIEFAEQSDFPDPNTVEEGVYAP